MALQLLNDARVRQLLLTVATCCSRKKNAIKKRCAERMAATQLNVEGKVREEVQFFFLVCHRSGSVVVHESATKASLSVFINL